MSQRASGFERKERDLYETPEWVTQALVPHLPRAPKLTWEPAAGTGKMSRALATYLGPVVSSDIEPHPLCYTADFLQCPPHDGADAIITNPPYELATEFVQRALGNVPNGGIVAMLLRTDFDHAKTRGHLFAKHPSFAKKVVLTKRIKWFEDSKGQPSFNHAWFIWHHGHQGAPTLAYGP
jgi:hypothetical protein